MAGVQFNERRPCIFCSFSVVLQLTRYQRDTLASVDCADATLFGPHASCSRHKDDQRPFQLLI